MKIIHLASGDLWAGAEVQLFHLAKRLARVKDISLLVVLLNHGQLEEELRNQGVDVMVLDESVMSGLAIFRSFYNIVREFQPDIVHTHRNKENVIGGLAAKLNGKKSIRTSHGAPEFAGSILNFKRFIFDSLDKLAALFLQQKIIAVSPELQEMLSREFSRSKLVMIENCVDIRYVESKSGAAAINIREKYPDAFHIVFVGRFVPVKRVDLFYEIAKAVIQHSSDKSVHFHMLGDGPLKSTIEAQLAADGLSTHIHLHGFVENVAPLLKQMDLLLITSDHEGLPMTLLEAMTLQVPVLSRAIPSIRRVLCDGSCGYIVESDKVERFISIIEGVMTDTTDVNARVAAARARIETNYNIDINLENYLQLYSMVLGRASKQ
ncbi:MAG: glycosyltransferase [Gammaproteobacteria bacterium]|nr:glycosyltransferase [Gammaproteobacteria bacterium]